MFAALAGSASHPAVAAWFAVATAGVAAVVVAMAWSVNARQIRLAERLARRQFLVTSEIAARSRDADSAGADSVAWSSITKGSAATGSFAGSSIAGSSAAGSSVGAGSAGAGSAGAGSMGAGSMGAGRVAGVRDAAGTGTAARERLDAAAREKLEAAARGAAEEVARGAAGEAARGAAGEAGRAAAGEAGRGRGQAARGNPETAAARLRAQEAARGRAEGAARGRRAPPEVIEGPDKVMAGEQARYRVPSSGPHQVVTWAVGGGPVSHAPDPAHPDDLLLIADQPGDLTIIARVREGLAERRAIKSVTAVPDVTTVTPPFTLRLFLHGWGLVVVAVLIIGFAGALDALGNFTSSDFIALAVPLAALLGVIAVARGHGEPAGRPANGKRHPLG
ncbi:MAG: hypothetical protein JO037_25675 [Actinobacteria bacterium]|nr:hypothetical protein [Actinomycetota bacterium]